MEPFVQRIMAGGLSLVAGLWLVVSLDLDAVGWLLGLLLVIGGGASLLAGIARPLDI